MSDMQTPEENEVLQAVERFVYHRHRDLTVYNIFGWSEEDLERAKTTAGGYLEFKVENVNIEEKEVEDNDTTYYVETTMCFAVETGEELICDPETYKAYKLDDGSWHVEWYAS